MNKAQIFLLCAPVGSGKTTLLKKWSEPEICGGILSPKIEGVRYFEDIENGKLYKMDAENGIQIGKHTFSVESFKQAEKILESEMCSGKEWMIIDEIGPLEIRKECGLHQILETILNTNFTQPKKILIVVRDFMAWKFIEKYHLQHAKILPLAFFAEQSAVRTKIKLPVGIVLAGGESSRMKTDKALLNYSGKPQWKQVQDLLSTFCSEVIISVNKNQQKTWAENHADTNFMVDDQEFEGNGPIAALLTAAKNFPNRTLFLVGIDYPLIEFQHLIALNNARTADAEAVCYENNGFTEPLISIIEPQAFQKLFDFFAAGNTSAKKFLESVQLKKVCVEDAAFLTNINSSEEFANFTKNHNTSSGNGEGAANFQN